MAFPHHQPPHVLLHFFLRRPGLPDKTIPTNHRTLSRPFTFTFLVLNMSYTHLLLFAFFYVFVSKFESFCILASVLLLLSQVFSFSFKGLFLKWVLLWFYSCWDFELVCMFLTWNEIIVVLMYQSALVHYQYDFS